MRLTGFSQRPIGWAQGTAALFFMALHITVQAQFTYTTNSPDTNTVTITGYTGAGGAIAIPSNIVDKTVASIGTNAFYQRSNLTDIVIPNTVTIIDQGAFANCTSLTNVTIGNHVALLGPGAFANCESLSSVAIPHSVTHIGHDAFSSCTALTQVYIGNGVTNIDDWAFLSCANLTNVTIGYGLSRIGNYSFSGCDQLIDISIAEDNPAYSSGNGILFNKEKTALVIFPGGQAGTYLVPTSVATIGQRAFFACTKLTAVTIPDSVANIGSEAFRYCTALTNIVLGNGVTSIAYRAFSDCPQLKSTVIPDSVTYIDFNVFENCIRMTSVNIGNGVNIIPNMFNNCTSLVSAVIGSNVTSIRDGAFNNCTRLTKVYFMGNAPEYEDPIFSGANSATIYRLQESTGWPTVPNLWAGRPTALWLPEAMADKYLGLQEGQFGFNIGWARGKSVIIEACADLTTSNWTALATNTIINGSFYFGDPEWMNYPGRFYRFSSQ